MVSLITFGSHEAASAVTEDKANCLSLQPSAAASFPGTGLWPGAVHVIIQVTSLFPLRKTVIQEHAF